MSFRKSSMADPFLAAGSDVGGGTGRQPGKGVAPPCDHHGRTGPTARCSCFSGSLRLAPKAAAPARICLSDAVHQAILVPVTGQTKMPVETDTVRATGD